MHRSASRSSPQMAYVHLDQSVSVEQGHCWSNKTDNFEADKGQEGRSVEDGSVCMKSG